MRLLILMMLFCASYTQAGQHMRPITINKKQVSLDFVLKEIQRQTGLHIIWQPEKLEGNRKIDVALQDVNLNTAFEKLGISQKFSYAIQNNTVVLKPRDTSVSLQVSKLSGTVKEKKTGTVLKGVSVLLENASGKYTAATDQEGRFSIQGITTGIYQIHFSSVGYEKATRNVKIEAGKAQDMLVQLEEGVVAFEDVVVTGYQVLDRRAQTAAISSVKMEDIFVPGMSSIDMALEGRIPEMAVMFNSGEVGATPRLRVRGTSTILGNREPLWVLDGWPLTDPVDVKSEDLNNPDYINIIGNAIAGINPQDIDRIDVLKDAAATALYGTRAANGVIVVTTKKGTVGRTRVSYNHSSKLTRRPRYTDRAINLMSSQERVEFGRNLADMHYRFPSDMAEVGYEGALYRYYKGDLNYEQFVQEARWFETVNTDWFGLLTSDAYSQFHTADLSGGTQDVRYYGSFAYDNDKGVVNSSYTRRYSLRTNIDAGITDRLKLNFRVSGNVQQKNHVPNSINPMDYAYNTTRALPAYNPDGSLYYYKKTSQSVSRPYDLYNYNILNEIANSADGYDGSSVNGALDLKYTFSKDFDLSASGTYTRNSTMQEKWWGERSNYIAGLKNGEYGSVPQKGEVGKSELPYGGVLETNNTIGDNYGFRVQMDYRKRFGLEDRHLITATGGFEANGSTNRSVQDESRGYIKERGLQFVNGVADIDDYPLYKSWLNRKHRNIGHGITNMVSGYLTASYSYANYFTVSANGRTDYSNKFGDRSNERFLPVWALSGMWNLKETFLQDGDFLTDWRLRTSFGKQGNMLPDQSPNLIMKIGTLDPFYNENTSTLGRFPNPNLRWEQTSSFNASMDLSLFDSKLDVNATYYLKQTSDCFAGVRVSDVNGISEYVMNNGELKNSGYSFSISTSPINKEHFKWRFYTSYSGNINRVQAGGVDSYEFTNYLAGTALVNNEAVGTFYAYRFLVLNPLSGLPVFDDLEDRKHLLMDKNLEETVKMTMVTGGNREPVFHGSFSNSFSYKSFNLSMNMTYSLGSKVRLFPLYAPIASGIKADANIRKEFVDRWQVPGDELYTDIPAIINPADPYFSQYNNHFSGLLDTKIVKFANSVWDMYDNSDLRVVSGNYLKMSSLMLRYSFNNKQLKRTPFSAASLSFNTMNLFTLGAKELKGQDPSQAGFAGATLSLRPAYTLQFNVSF